MRWCERVRGCCCCQVSHCASKISGVSLPTCWGSDQHSEATTHDHGYDGNESSNAAASEREDGERDPLYDEDAARSESSASGSRGGGCEARSRWRCGGA